MIRQTSTPDSSGSIRSSRTRSGRSARNSASASRPSAAAMARYPSSSSASTRVSRSVVSSSTTRIVRPMRAGSCRAGVNAVFTAGSPAAAVVNDPFISAAAGAGSGAGTAARLAIAASMRASVRSRPSATSVSNSGGVAVIPVVATRIAMNRSPAFQPRASTSSRSGGSSSSASQVTPSWAASRSRAAARPSAVVATSQRLGTRRAGSTSSSSPHRKPTRSTIAARVGSRSRTIGRSGAELVRGGRPVDVAVDLGRLEERAAAARPGRRRRGAGSTAR